MRGEKCIISEVPQLGKLKQLHFFTSVEYEDRGEDNKNKHYFTPQLMFCSCNSVLSYLRCMIKNTTCSLHIHK